MRFIIAVILFLSSACLAAADLPTDTFQNAEQIDSAGGKTFVGKPAVIIEKDTLTQPEVNRAELLPAPVLNRQDMPITTPYGHKRTAAFVDHTTDFALTVQLLDDHTAHINEIIQIITTREIPAFKRIYPDKDITVLSVRENKTDLPYTLTDGALEITQPLSPGLHRIVVSYTTTYPHTTDNAISDIVLSLTGTDWPLITERFSLVLLLPKKGSIYTNELLFGTNNQKIDQEVQINKDPAGAIIYQLTHPLPAYAEVKLHLTADSAIFPKANRGLTDHQILTLIYLTILCGYTILSIITARRKKHTKALKTARRINPILWYLALGHDLSALTTSDKRQVACQPPLKIIAFIRFNYEYIIGLILLNVMALMMAHYADTAISYWLMWGSAAVSVFLIHLFGTKQELLNLLTTLRHILMETPQGLNLPSREIGAYYTVACLFGFGSLWEKQLKKQNPSYAIHLRKQKGPLSSPS